VFDIGIPKRNVEVSEKEGKLENRGIDGQEMSRQMAPSCSVQKTGTQHQEIWGARERGWGGGQARKRNEEPSGRKGDFTLYVSDIMKFVSVTFTDVKNCGNGKK
jgi:hypothetical protein